MHSLARFQRRLRGRPGSSSLAAVAATTAVSVVASWWVFDDYYGDSGIDNSLVDDKRDSRSSIGAALQTSACEGALLTFPRLRRQATIEQLQVTASPNRLENTYRVRWDDKLGEGAYGSVYLAHHKITGEAVAVKEIDKRFTDSTNFQREMDALLRIREFSGHPHVCGMREHFEQGNFFYIVMDLVTGREMFEQLCENGPFSEADAALRIRETASALAFLHGIGIVHADIKPENIMLSSQNPSEAIVKIVDFGCAHLGDEDEMDNYSLPSFSPRSTITSGSYGHSQTKGTGMTPAYCPPEILKMVREKTDKTLPSKLASSYDMWSLGCVLYTMLIGCHPFDIYADASDAEIEERVLSGKPPPLRNFELAKDLSKDAMTLIEGLLDPDPKKRWTADQVLENPWVQGITAKSQKIPLSDKRLAAYRRHKTKVGSAFFKLLLSSTDRLQTGPNSCNSRTNTSRSSLFETAFHQLDPENRGYVSTKEFDRENSLEDEDVRLSLDDISALLSEHMKNRYFPKGHVLHREGDSGDAMYLIDSGKVECSNKEGVSKIRLPGDIFGQEVLNSEQGGHAKNGSQAYDSTARCLTPVHVIEISRELYEKYVASDVESFLSMAEHQRHHKRERASALLRLQCSENKTKYSQGETMFRAGEEGSNLIVLESGEIDILVNGNLIVRKLQQPGEMAGEHGAFFGKPYNVTAKCVGENGCLVRTLPASAMHRAFVEDPSLRTDFRDLMLRRDFKKAMCAKIQRAFPTSEKEIRDAFDIMDADGSGEISLDELRAVVKRFDPSYSEDDIHDMLESLDLNHSGTLTWVEFLRIFSMDKET